MTICTSHFEFLARSTAAGLGMPDLRLVVVSHPIGGISPEEVIGKADNIIDDVIAHLTR